MAFTPLLCLPPGQAQAQVIISEFLAVNDKGLPDAEGDRLHWIEVHNAGDSRVNLAGWSLTDNAKDLVKWKFPAVNIEGGDYLLVFASGKNRVEPSEGLHTSFKLAGNGEYLAIVKPDGKTVAHYFFMKYPKQRDDISYGISADWKPDASSPASVIAKQVYFLTPTPGVPNGKMLVGKVAKLVFSHKHGFYEESFELEIKSQPPGSQIRFTSDGTGPSRENGSVLNGPLTIDKTTVIRAAAFKLGHKATKVVTRTYLFLEDVVRQSPDGLPPPGFHYEWGRNVVDYGMDPVSYTHLPLPTILLV